jgi:hypothetical protein
VDHAQSRTRTRQAVRIARRHSVYGEQQDVDGIRLIPVALSWSGFGAGEDPSGSNGGGGGGFAVPLGAYIRKGDDLRFEPNLVSLLAVAIPFVWVAGRALPHHPCPQALTGRCGPRARRSGGAGCRVPPRHLDHPIVLIDGRSGAGKSTLARGCASGGRARRQLVALDDSTPGGTALGGGGWLGSSSSIRLPPRGALASVGLGGGRAGCADDDTAGPASDRRRVRRDHSGIRSPRADPGVAGGSAGRMRKARALARDGEAYRPHWERWAAQEVRHLADDDPTAHATIVVDVP